MAGLPFTDALRQDYRNLFSTCIIRPGKEGDVDHLVTSLAGNRGRYQAVGGPLNIPWYFIAVIHNMEASQRLTGHLHNGDPLTARTVQVPAGRPRTGRPPFTWEESATDALTMHSLPRWTDWSVAGTLYQLELYNGTGYRRFHPQVKSPYLWGFSNHYTSGKYVADGTWSDTAVSKQCGAAVLLRRMIEKGLFGFDDEPLPVAGAGPLVVPFAKAKPTDPAMQSRAINLQNWLNSHTGIFVRVDGWPGQGTSDAYKLVTGRYLPGDPRG